MPILEVCIKHSYNIKIGTYIIIYFKNYVLVPTRRGDFEILVYNLIHWAGGTLPWEKKLTSPTAVQAMKEEAGKNVDQFLKTCFNKQDVPSNLFD